MIGNEYHLRPVGGGVIKAHEVERRGPTLLAAQGTRNQMSEDTIDRVEARNEQMANVEQAMALEQERQARVREAAAQQSVAERDEELAGRQADFDGTVKQLGQMGQIDRGRFYASMSTPQKIAGFVELAIAGFRGAPSMILKRIDDDVKAQEFAFYATRDTAQAKQTAFSQAMQKYQNVDAARAVSRAAAIEVTQAQFAQVSAKWKGTESANRADITRAALQDEKMMQAANGIQFVQSQMAARRHYDPRTGLVYSEQEAHAASAKVDERDFENRKQVAGIGGQLKVEEAKGEYDMQKAQLAQQKGQRSLLVQLPGGTMPDGTPVQGETVRAPDEKEASKLRDIVAARNSLASYVDEVLQIRSDASWLASPTKTRRLEQLSTAMDLEGKNLHELGVLAGPDMTLLSATRGNLKSMMPGIDAQIRNVKTLADTKIRGRTKTYSDATTEAKGELPSAAAADFKAYGGKK